MTMDVEELLIRTLDDARHRQAARPGQFADLAPAVRRVRRRRAAGVAAAVALLLGGAAAVSPWLPVGSRTSAPTARPTLSPAGSAAVPSPSESPMPASGLGEQLTAAPVAANDLALSPRLGAASALWVCSLGTDSQVAGIDPASGAVIASVRLPATPATCGVRIDPGTGAVWAWAMTSPASATDTVSTVTVIRIDPATGRVLARQTARADVYDGAAGHDRLWLSGPQGVWRFAVGTPPVLVPALSGLGSTGYTSGVAYQAAIDRLLAVVSDTSAKAVDVRTGKQVASTALWLGKTSLVVTGDDQVWAAGYSTDQPTVLHLDPATLGVLGGSAASQGSGVGAIAWAGSSVVWVRNGSDEGLSCVRASDGVVERRWDAVQGPVASNARIGAFAVHDGLVYRLPLSEVCPG
jgi:hypothetical protein